MAIAVPETSGSERDEPASGDADSLRVFFAPAIVAEPERVHVQHALGRPRMLDHPSLGLSDAGILDVRFMPDSNRDLGFRQFIGPAVRPLPTLTVAELRG